MQEGEGFREGRCGGVVEAVVIEMVHVVEERDTFREIRSGRVMRPLRGRELEVQEEGRETRVMRPLGGRELEVQEEGREI